MHDIYQCVRFSSLRETEVKCVSLTPNAQDLVTLDTSSQ